MMIRAVIVSFFLMLMALLAGCGTVAGVVGGGAKGHEVVDRQGLDLVVEDASRKTTVIKDKNSAERFCRSPNPDFASGQSNAVSLGLPNGPSVGTSAGAMIDSLGGRSPALLITRELMYRACELSLNLDANADLSKEIYWKFLSLVETAMKTQSGTGVQGSTVSNSVAASGPVMVPPGNTSTAMPGGSSMPGGVDPSMWGGGPMPGYPGPMPGSAGPIPSGLPAGSQ